MKHTFTVIDFETAQGRRCSICQVGLVRVEKRSNHEGDFFFGATAR